MLLRIVWSDISSLISVALPVWDYGYIGSPWTYYFLCICICFCSSFKNVTVTGFKVTEGVFGHGYCFCLLSLLPICRISFLQIHFGDELWVRGYDTFQYWVRRQDFPMLSYKNVQYFILVHAQKPKFGPFFRLLVLIFFLPLLFPFSRLFLRSLPFAFHILSGCC